MINEFVYPLRIHIEDTDFTGVVYHANYLNFMERARSEWIDELGIGTNWRAQHNIQFLIHSLQMQFLKPVQVHEKVEVISKFKKLNRTSLIFEQHLRLAHSPDKIICQAEIKIACVDRDMQPCEIPHTPIFETIRRTLT